MGKRRGRRMTIGWTNKRNEKIKREKGEKVIKIGRECKNKGEGYTYFEEWGRE
jgi:hypothetical protein